MALATHKAMVLAIEATLHEINTIRMQQNLCTLEIRLKRKYDVLLQCHDRDYPTDILLSCCYYLTVKFSDRAIFRLSISIRESLQTNLLSQIDLFIILQEVLQISASHQFCLILGILTGSVYIICRHISLDDVLTRGILYLCFLSLKQQSICSNANHALTSA